METTGIASGTFHETRAPSNRCLAIAKGFVAFNIRAAKATIRFLTCSRFNKEKHAMNLFTAELLQNQSTAVASAAMSSSAMAASHFEQRNATIVQKMGAKRLSSPDDNLQVCARPGFQYLPCCWTTAVLMIAYGLRLALGWRACRSVQSARQDTSEACH
mmetsp:Transcript_3136/g.8916  ORF Transcript_3136/g.8916 Transcript_3136/m.8916 type:complete len:159 (-) Transcript_3136:1228-1704(-)